MDNRDGTLSIFGTAVDHASATTVPTAGTTATNFGVPELAALDREFAFNDPQKGGGTGEGTAADRNVELLVNDPRYPRPGSGSPLRVPLVPEFKRCTSPNTSHAAPLSQPSCKPPVQESSLLTTSRIGQGGGFARLDVLPGNPSTSADDADVNIFALVTDVRRASDGTDYIGKVLLSTIIRITDSANGPSETQSATVADTKLSFPIDCVATSDPVLGSTCNVNTTADALVPGLVREGDRTVISALGVNVEDAGADGSIAPPSEACPPSCGSGDENVFLRQGLFAP
jgi:hypothetical protein